MQETNENLNNNKKLFTLKEYIFFFFLFLMMGFIFIFLANTIARILNHDISTVYPLSMYAFFIPSFFEILMTLTIFMGFLVIIYFFTKFEFNIHLIVLFGIILIILTNLIHGIHIGLEKPIIGFISPNNIELYNEALKIKDPLDFIQNYEDIQESLVVHAQTHPPGAVLLFFIFYKLIKFPFLISLTICIITASLSSIYIYKIFSDIFDKDIAKFLCFLYLLIPAVQIYYLANLYAIVNTFFLGIIYYYFYSKRKSSYIGLILLLFILSFISFMFLFIMGFLFMFESLKIVFIKKKPNFLSSYKKLIIMSCSIMIIYLLFLVFMNFNYFNSFIIASSIENSEGFLLFSDPVEYGFTRVENILDILIHLGPFLIVLFFKGLNGLKKSSLETYIFIISPLITLIIMFLAGVFRTGETARGFMVIYFFLIYPIGCYLQKNKFSTKEKSKLLAIVFIQTLIMQLIGIYYY